MYVTREVPMYIGRPGDLRSCWTRVIRIVTHRKSRLFSVTVSVWPARIRMPVVSWMTAPQLQCQPISACPAMPWGTPQNFGLSSSKWSNDVQSTIGALPSLLVIGTRKVMLHVAPYASLNPDYPYAAQPCRSTHSSLCYLRRRMHRAARQRSRLHSCFTLTSWHPTAREHAVNGRGARKHQRASGTRRHARHSPCTSSDILHFSGVMDGLP